MGEVTISVLTPVRNEERHVADTVRSMRDQDVEEPIELIFIDGRSEDRTMAILRELAEGDDRIVILDNPARTTPEALNIGLAAARGRYVARMDAHTHYPPGYLRAGVERLRTGGAAHVSGPQLPHGTGVWSRRAAAALGTRLGAGGAAFRRLAGGETEADSGFTGIWERDTLLRHGGWDEGWPNDQDSELAARIRAEGGRIVVVPEMAARYIPRDSLPALARQYWRYGFYRAKTSRRHPDSMRRSHVLTPGLVLAFATAALPLGRVARAARAGLAVYCAALVAAAAFAAREQGVREAAWLPVTLAAMHLPNGAGFLAGAVRWGPPLRALGRIARGR